MSSENPFEPTPVQRAEFRLRVCRLEKIAKRLMTMAGEVETTMVPVVCGHVEQTWGNTINAQSQRNMATSVEFLFALMFDLSWNIKREAKFCREHFLPAEESNDITAEEPNDDWELPETWKGKMKALVAGAVDYDDWHELAMECAKVADRDPRITEPWSDTMPLLLDWLLGSQGQETPKAKKLFAETATDIVRCGEAADLVVAGEVPVTV